MFVHKNKKIGNFTGDQLSFEDDCILPRIPIVCHKNKVIKNRCCRSPKIKPILPIR